jgi:hypothetical protein
VPAAPRTGEGCFDSVEAVDVVEAVDIAEAVDIVKVMVNQMGGEVDWPSIPASALRRHRLVGRRVHNRGYVGKWVSDDRRTEEIRTGHNLRLVRRWMRPREGLWPADFLDATVPARKAASRCASRCRT